VIDRKVFDEQEGGEILSVATDFPKLWNDPKAPNRERKRMAHLILEDVTLSRGIEVTMHVRFKGGLTQTLTVPLAQNGWKKYMTAPEIITEIDHLLNDHTDSQIAQIFNERGMTSGRRLRFTGEIIAALRKRHNLKSRYDRLRTAGMLDTAEIAKLLGTSMRTIYVWRRQGILRIHLYNHSGGCLYERPGQDSLLESADRRYRHGKT
jgi:Helix-turn-helix domain